MREAKPANPTNRSLRYTTHPSGRARPSGDWRWIRHSGFVQKERNPLFDVGVVVGRAAAELVSAVAVPDELSIAERRDAVDVAGAVSAA